MSTQILNNGVSINIVKNGVSRLLLKSQIKEVNVAKDGMVKIEACGCSTPCFYIRHEEVTNPATASPEALRDAIMTMLPSGNAAGTAAGGATEMQQITQTSKLSEIKAAVTDNLSDKALASKQEEQTVKLQHITTAVVNGSNLISTTITNHLADKATAANQQAQTAELQNITTTIASKTDQISSTITEHLTNKALASKQDEQLNELVNIRDAVSDVSETVTATIRDQLSTKATKEAQDLQL
ncbi:MAG: hypothetical protein EWV91_06995, partial [Microcystis aeruginosa Ma_QC_Ca_00000000_S207]